MASQEESVIAELRQMLTNLYKKDQFKIHDKIIDFHDHLKAKYPLHQRYRLYHLISLSTLKEPVEFFDFPGEDSIDAFIRKEHSLSFPDGSPYTT